MNELSDKEILKIFKDDNENYAFNLLVRKYQQRLYWHIRRMVFNHEDTDDVLQNTFIKVWKGLDKFREEANLYTWLYRIATNESITFIKQKAKKSNTRLDDESNFLSETLKSDDYFNGDEAQKLLFSAIATLPDKQKAVFNMKYFEEMKYDDMAKILNTSVGALKASYHHAVKKIERYLDDH